MQINGEALRVIRERSGLTGTALAEMVGVDRTHISNIEAGRKQPSPELARRLADALKVPLIAILANFRESGDE